MSNEISPEHERFLEQVVTEGKYPSRSEALNAAVELLRRRIELLGQIDEGTRQLRNGEYTDYDDESLRERFEQIKREGRQRLEAKKSRRPQ